MGFCSAVPLAFATIFSLVAAALLAIAFSTDNWITITVERDLLKVSAIVMRSEENQDSVCWETTTGAWVKLWRSCSSKFLFVSSMKWKKLSTKVTETAQFSTSMLLEFKYYLNCRISLNFVLVLCFKCRISTLANIQIVQMFAEFVSKMGIYFAKFWHLMVERTMCFMTTGEDFVVTIIILWTVELPSHDEFRFSQSLDNKRAALVFRELIGWGGRDGL